MRSLLRSPSLVSLRPLPLGLLVVAIVVMTMAPMPAASAGTSRSPDFPASVTAPVLPGDVQADQAVVAVYRTGDATDADPTVAVEFRDRFDLPAGEYRVSVYVGDPSGDQVRASLVADSGDVRGVVERSNNDGTFDEVGSTEARFDRLTARIAVPADELPDGGSLWVEVDTDDADPVGTPFFPLDQLLDQAEPGVLTASDVVLTGDGPASLPASPTVEVDGTRLTVTYAEAPPTEVGGQQLENVVDVVRLAPSFGDAGQARYQIAIDNGEGRVILFDNQGGFPLAVDADPSTWLVTGLDGASATAGTTIEVDLEGVFDAFGFTPTDNGTAVGLARSLTVDQSTAIRADGALGTLAWFDSANQAAPESDGGAPPASDTTSNDGGSGLPILLVVVIVGILLVAVVAWVWVRRASAHRAPTTPMRLTLSRGPQSETAEVEVSSSEREELDRLTEGLFGDESPPGPPDVAEPAEPTEPR